MTLDTLTTLTRTHGKASVVLAVLCLLGSSVALAKKADDAEHLSWQDGLSQTTVFSIHHDEEGSVWFGTEDGLNRFDGQSFKVYRHDPRNPESLPANLVRAIDADAEGRIWLATEGGGVAAWKPATDSFTTYRRNPLLPSAGLGSDYTRSVKVDQLGFVWVATRDAGLDRLDPVTGAVSHYRHDSGAAESLADNRVYALVEARDGSLYVGTNDGLDRFDSATQGFEHMDLGSVSKAIRVRALYEDSQGVLWIGTNGAGLVSLDPLTGEVGHFCYEESDATSLSDDSVRTILEDGFGQLWVGTSRGLNVLDRESGTFERYGKVDVSAAGGSGAVTSLHLDARNSLWVGTELGGLIRWEGNKGSFRDSKGQTADIVTSFTQDRKGTLYFGTVGNGLARVDKKGRVKHFKPADDDTSDAAGAISDDRVMALHTDSKNRIWVGTMRGGLNRFSPKKETFISYRHDPENPTSLSADGVMALHEDSAGTLWVGTFGGGLNAFDDVSRAFVSFRHDPDDPTTLGSDRVTTVLGTESGSLWVGTDGGGLNLLDPATGIARRFQHDPLNPTSLPSDTVCALFVDRFGTLWIGTRGGGLAKMISGPNELTDPIFLSYTEADGLPNSVVYAIQPDSDGNFWLSTNHGLSLFDPSAMTFTNFDADDGLQANEFNFGASYRNAEGELFFGGINGYNAFTPEGTRQSSGSEVANGPSGKKPRGGASGNAVAPVVTAPTVAGL